MPKDGIRSKKPNAYWHIDVSGDRIETARLGAEKLAQCRQRIVLTPLSARMTTERNTAAEDLPIVRGHLVAKMLAWLTFLW